MKRSLFCLLLTACLLFGYAAADFTLPADTTTIEAAAFEGVTGMKELVIPAGVTSVGSRAFANTGLNRVWVESKDTVIAEDAFAGTNATVYAFDNGSTSSDVTRFDRVAGKTYLLAIGNSNYGANGEYDLPACSADADGMAAAMARRGVFVTTRKNLTASQITAAIRETFSKAGPDDMCIFYYSGHGLNGTMAGSLVGVTYMQNGTDFLRPATLRSTLDSLSCRRVTVIIDACFSGALIEKRIQLMAESTEKDLTEETVTFNINLLNAFANPMAKAAGELATSSRYTVYTACSGTEQSFCTASYSFYTRVVARMLGWDYYAGTEAASTADGNADGFISAAELGDSLDYDYMYDTYHQDPTEYHCTTMQSVPKPNLLLFN